MNQKKCLVMVLALFVVAAMSAERPLFEENKRAVLYLGDAPTIDGQFDDWVGLQGSVALKEVYVGMQPEGDSQGFFIIRTDNRKLYIYAYVPDAKPNENDFPAPIAWRNDSIEVYLGASLAPHNRYLKDDSQIRIVPRSKTDSALVGVSVNDRDIPSGFTGAAVYHDNAWEVEAAIPLNFLMFKRVEIGQTVRVEFQVNDADDTERDRLIHWSSPKDDTYYDPSSWGNAIVVALPARQ